MSSNDKAFPTEVLSVLYDLTLFPSLLYVD